MAKQKNEITGAVRETSTTTIVYRVRTVLCRGKVSSSTIWAADSKPEIPKNAFTAVSLPTTIAEITNIGRFQLVNNDFHQSLGVKKSVYIKKQEKFIKVIIIFLRLTH